MTARFFIALLFLSSSVTAWCQPASAEALEDLLAKSLSREELRTLTNKQGQKEIFAASEILNKKLAALNVQTHTFITVSSGQTTESGFPDEKNRTMLRGNIKAVRAHGIPVYASLDIRVPDAQVDKLKECRSGRKVVASGTISEIRIYGGEAMLMGPNNTRIFGKNMVRFTV